jgi:hypothetical protein
VSDSNWHAALEILREEPEHEPGKRDEPAPEDTPPLPVTPPVPLNDALVAAEDIAQRAITRAGYELTGYVLTQRTRGSKCVIDGKTAAWLNADAAKDLLQWKRPKPAPWVDQAPPESEDEVERHMRVLANRLGIPFNSTVPHNTGFFVPGVRNAYPTAWEAIEALFELVYTSPDATVYRPGKAARASGVIVISGNVTVSGDIVAAPPLGMGPAPVGVAGERMSTPKPKAPPPAVETPQMGLF